jgi:hypothetical protein
MQKDEDYLLGPWLAYHGHMFGFQRLYVLDNGSMSSRANAVLRKFESLGVHVDRRFNTRDDFCRKGEIVGSVIRSLDVTNRFDFLMPLDCDEFVLLRTPWGYTCQKDSILAYLETLLDEMLALRVPYQLANNPFARDFYTCFNFTKTLFARGTFESLDVGYHAGTTKGRPGNRIVDLVHIHWHYPPHPTLASRSRRKWTSPIPPEMALSDPFYDGRSAHLIPYFSMSPAAYRSWCMDRVQFYIPAFLSLLEDLEHPILLAESDEWSTMPLLPSLDDSARIDNGMTTRTVMLVPPGSGAAQWTKVYLNEDVYLKMHPDVAAAGQTALGHFCSHGYREAGRVKSLN